MLPFDKKYLQQQMAQGAPPSHRRGLTIRLKLTLWYGTLFLIAGVLLIAINYFLVRDSLAVAPEKARAAVAKQFGIPRELLEVTYPGSDLGGVLQPGGLRRPGRGGLELYVETQDGVLLSVPQLLRQAQYELKEEALRQLWTRSLLALGIITVLTFGLAWVLAGRMLRPLQAITATARRLSSSNLHERIALKGPRDELKELADTFDEMLGRLDAAFQAQKDFVANASHELRTPLTIIRTEIDVALSNPNPDPQELQEMGAAITEAVERSERLIDSLLVLARADSPPSMVDLDLAQVAQKEVERAAAEADARGLKLDLDLSPAPVRGEPYLIERMIANLVENAIRHNVDNGWFAVRTYTAADQAVLEVANSGPAIAREDVERLFDRFYRPDRSRSRKTGGFGLGLSIVKSVVTAHGGSVELEPLEGGGLRAIVALPAAQTPSSRAAYPTSSQPAQSPLAQPGTGT